MSGQFPDRVSPAGVFSENADDAALGGAGFVRWVDLGATVEVVANDELELPLGFIYPTGAAIPCVAGSVFQVDLSGFALSEGSKAPDSGEISLSVGVEGVTNVEGSTTISTMVLELSGNDSPLPLSVARKCMIVAEEGTTELTGLRVVLTTSADWGSRTVTFNASNLQGVVRRVQ